MVGSLMPPNVLVVGTQGGERPSGVPESETGARYVVAEGPSDVRANIADADVIYAYGPPIDDIRRHWSLARRLRWLHVGGVGVDWALFPELVESDVVLTNTRGIFDETLPEYLLTLMLALVKDLPGTVRDQDGRRWRHRWLEPIAGGRVVIIGAGSIARAARTLLRKLGLSVTLVARSERGDERDADRIRAVSDLREILTDADWLIVLAPLTEETRGLVGEAQLASLPVGARVVNIGRGPIIDSSALIAALHSGHIGAAALDVFEDEPLPDESPLWSMPNVIVSPHIGGDVVGTPAAFGEIFLANLRRYIANDPLDNIVDKQTGYVASS